MSDELLDAAGSAIALGSRSFALASRLFDPAVRRRAILLYAWCRHCDDMVDGQQSGRGVEGVAAAAGSPETLAALARATDRALAGTRTGEMPFDALATVAAEVPLARFPHDLLAGFALDVAGFRPETEDDLLRYCYHVAGCVGVMMALAMGVPADDHPTLARASDLGLSFQLGNIARDIGEDAAAGRCYLPAAWLADDGLDRDNYFAPGNRVRLHRVACRLVALAGRYEESARHGTPLLKPRQAWAVLAAARIYGAIGRSVAAGGPAMLERRVFTSTPGKLGAVLLALGDMAGRRRRWPAPGPERSGLFTPPFG